VKRSEVELFLAMIEPDDIVEKGPSPLGFIVVALTSGGIVGFLLLELIKLGMIKP